MEIFTEMKRYKHYIDTESGQLELGGEVGFWPEDVSSDKIAQSVDYPIRYGN